MDQGKEMDSTVLEWRVTMSDGTKDILVVESDGNVMRRIWRVIKEIVMGFVLGTFLFLSKAWNIGVNEPKKVRHCLKVGMALSLVSVFYYMRPLYQGLGGTAMWAVLTVVVVFEYTVGATISKSLNRATGTFLAGSLGVGVHWIASQCGDNFEPIVLEFTVFLLASAATFSRFIPSVKARFDYGAMVFILTFSLVSISGYRVDKLLELAHHRLSTIGLGTSICILISMIIYPVWAGQELHFLITRNLEKLADSLDGCVAEYFKEDSSIRVSEASKNNAKNHQGYKCVLNSKATEDAMANFARWEPAHGRFLFQHPWKQYLKIGASMRNCAYCIETLNSCINSDIQAGTSLKKHFNDACTRLSRHSSNVIKELAVMMKKMRVSSTIKSSLTEMKEAVQDLQNVMQSLQETLKSEAENNDSGELLTKSNIVPLIEILPVATVATLLTEIASRIEKIVDEVEELALKAKFKPIKQKKSKQNGNKKHPFQDSNTSSSC